MSKLCLPATSSLLLALLCLLSLDGQSPAGALAGGSACNYCRDELDYKRNSVSDMLTDAWSTLLDACRQIDEYAMDQCYRQKMNVSQRVEESFARDFVAEKICRQSCDAADLLLAHDNEKLQRKHRPGGSKDRSSDEEHAANKPNADRSSGPSAEQNSRYPPEGVCEKCREDLRIAANSVKEVIKQSRRKLIRACGRIDEQVVAACNNAVKVTNVHMDEIFQQGFNIEKICQIPCKSAPNVDQQKEKGKPGKKSAAAGGNKGGEKKESLFGTAISEMLKERA